MSVQIRAHIRNNVVGYVALFAFAMSGSAYALSGTNTVDSGDIINGQVKAADIGAGQVKASDLTAGAVNGAKVANGSLSAADVDPTSLQRRVGGSCVAGSAIQSVNQDGTVACQPAGAGTITGVTAGTGLTGGGTSGSVGLDLASGFRLPQSCANGQVAKSDGVGSWSCANDTDTDSGGDITAVSTGGGLTGGATSGDVSLGVDTSVLQRRVGAACSTNQAIRSIAANGGVTCETQIPPPNASVTTSKFATLPAVRVHQTSNQSINTDSSATLDWGAEDYDTASFHSMTSNTTRFFVLVAGKYQIEASVAWSHDPDGVRQLQIIHGSVGTIARSQVPPVAEAAFETDQPIATTYQMSQGDFVELRGYQFSGNTLSTDAPLTTFEMHWIGP